MSANEITALLLVEIPMRFPQCRVWRVNSMAALTPAGRLVKAGPKGLADISGIAGPDGRRIEIEVKAERDRMRDKQKSFRRMVLAHGGIHLVARDVETALNELGAALRANEAVQP